MSELFEQCKEIIRAGSVEVLRRSAANRKTTIVICSWCKAFMTEQPAQDKGGISVCKRCLPGPEERIN